MWSVDPVQSGFSCLSLTKFSRNSLERLPIRPYNASTNYKRITKSSRWLRWDEELAHSLVASNQPDLLVIQAASRRRALKSQRAKAKGGPMTKHLLGLILLGSALLLSGTYGLGVLVSDFDNDGWPDIYVANDSTSAALYKNNHDGTFTDIALEAGVASSPDGKPQEGMGVSAGNYDGDGHLDIVKTNFAGDTTSLYRNLGKMAFDDQTFQAGLGKNTRFLGWGAGFIDFDNDGWPDISLSGGPGILEKVAGRGCAFGDLHNDGDIDVRVNCVNDVPKLLPCDESPKNNWLKVKTIGVKSNRSGIGARIYCSTAEGRRQMDEVRSGGSYLSQNDLRAHFGLGKATGADIEVHWPSGVIDRFRVSANQVVTVIAGKGRRF